MDVERYAEIAAALADPEVDRASVLAANGLDEDAWDALDETWQERLAAAQEAHGDEDGVPDLVLRHAQAFAEAQQQRGEVMALDRFLRCVALARTATDLPLALRKIGVTLAQFLRANHHWMAKAQDDPELMERLLR
jgi:hypothetical protein